MNTAKFPSSTGLGIAAVYVVIGVLAACGVAGLLAQFGPGSLSESAILRISTGVPAVVAAAGVARAFWKARA